MSENIIIEIIPLGFPWETQDPFLFCAYHKDKYPVGNEKLGPDTSLLEGRNIGQDFTIKDGWRMYHGETIPGFPHHPHRGFETITINKQGFVDHSDSLGASGRFGRGDVQWMTAGKGVQHSEMFPLLNSDKENTLEIFQVWLNLPKASKMVDAHFKMLWADAIPLIIEKDVNEKITEINLIAGSLNGIQAQEPTPDSWAANPENEVNVWTIKMEVGAEWVMPAAKSDINRTLYFYTGSTLSIEESSIDVDHSIQVRSNEELRLKAGKEDAYILMLQGKPIKEPVAKYGPFVMNTMGEIQEAVNDYQRTQFGGWPWPRRDQVHDRNKGRFALHADGKEELK
jgi:redox-sensitive bicupin YhaK (pirin superfamily)